MPEGPPSRPSASKSGTGRFPKAGHATPARPIPAKTASSTRLPRPGGTTTRRVPATQRVEVITAKEDAEVTQVRRRVSGPKFRTTGLSLRWKVVFATVGITMATAALIFYVIYRKSLEQLNREIDAKGVRLVNLLASIDEDYWLTAIHTQPNSREADFDALISKLGGQKSWKSNLRQNQEDAYKRTLDPFGTARLNEVNQLISRSVTKPDWMSDVNSDPYLRRLYNRVARPLPRLENLRPLEKLKQQRDRDRDLLDAAVVDVTNATTGPAPAIMIDGHRDMNLSTFPIPKDGKMTKADGTRKEGTRTDRVRNFIINPTKEVQRDPNRPKLRYYVSLSLAGIDKAKRELLKGILLPGIVALVLGIGIAIWISTLITEPIKVLMNDINQVSSGKLDHQTHPVSKDEIGQLAITFNRMTQALRGAQETELEARAMEHDLNIASEIQSNLVPKRMLKIPGYDIGAYYRPSKEVGGDYYDFIEINDDLEGIIVADVSGKGVPGSLVMSMARAFVRMEAERSRNVSAADTLMRVNRMLAHDIKKGMFVTAIYGILNKRSNELLVASAGHNPMVVWRAAQNQVTLVNPNGIALGFDKGPVFERTVKEERLVLNRGDRIVMYTDGAVEAMDINNKEFGDRRFYGLIKELATRDSNQMLNLVVKTLDEHKGNAPQSDDITIVTLRYL